MADASQYLANAEAMATDQLKEQAGLLGLIDRKEGEAAVGEKEVVREALVGGSEENIKIPEGLGEKKLEGAEAENEGARSSTVGFEGMGKEEEISKGDIGDGAERVNDDSKEEVDEEKKEELEEETKEEILPAEKVEGLISKEEDGIKTEDDYQLNRKEESSAEPVDTLDCLKQKDENVEIEADKERAQLDITDQRNNDEDLYKLKDKEEVAENIQSSEDEKNKEGILNEANKETIEEPEKEELEKSHSNYSTVIFRI